MENATLTPRRQGPEVPAPGTGGRLRLPLSWPGRALLALALGTLAVTLLYPTYPNYDSVYSLLWGRELLHGDPLSFRAYRAPTEHPLAIAFGAIVSLLGEGGDRVMLFAALASFVALGVLWREPRLRGDDGHLEVGEFLRERDDGGVDVAGHGDGVGARVLVDDEPDRRLPVEPRDGDRVGRGQADGGHIAEPDARPRGASVSGGSIHNRALHIVEPALDGSAQEADGERDVRMACINTKIMRSRRDSRKCESGGRDQLSRGFD